MPDNLASRLSVIGKMNTGRGGEADRAVCPTLNGPRLGCSSASSLPVSVYFAVSGPELTTHIYATVQP